MRTGGGRRKPRSKRPRHSVKLLVPVLTQVYQGLETATPTLSALCTCWGTQSRTIGLYQHISFHTSPSDESLTMWSDSSKRIFSVDRDCHRACSTPASLVCAESVPGQQSRCSSTANVTFPKVLVSAVITVKDSCNRSRDDLEVTVPRHPKARTVHTVHTVHTGHTDVCSRECVQSRLAAIDAC